MNITDDNILKNIRDGYLVGGAVRDFLMNKTSYDKDIAIYNAENFAKKIADQLEGYFIVLDEINKIYRVVLKDKLNYLDISELQGKTIEDDLLRRDFTINAIAYDLKNNKFIDISGGIEDIKSKKIRLIKEENLVDDSLRILRAFRFASTTGFEITQELKEAICKHKNLILNPAKERISYELMKLFGGKYSKKALLQMDEIGILEEIIPYVKEMKQIPPNSHHHLDLFHHLLETTEYIQNLYENLPEDCKNHLDNIDFGGFSRLNHLKLAGFLHDIGKFSTWTIENSETPQCKANCKDCSQNSATCGIRHRFIKHDDVGAKLVVQYLKDMKFSKKQIEYISNMIKTHIYPSSVVSLPNLNDKIMMRYLRKMGVNVADNIILAKADRLSARGIAITEENIRENLENLDKLLNFYIREKENLKPLPKLLDGYEIMEIKGVSKGPVLGEIVNALKEAQISGDVVTKEDAIAFVKNL